MALVLSGSIDISGSMTATTIIVSAPGAAGMVSSSAQITELAPLMAYTSSLKGAAIVSSSQQIQNYFTFAQTSSANTFYGNQTISGGVTATGTITMNKTGGYGILAQDDGNNVAANGAYIGWTNNATNRYFIGQLDTSNDLNYHYFNGSTWAASIMKFTNVGGASFSDNVVMASGKGIDFSATSNGSGTTSSELLNDYEEGTWTPTVRGSGDAGTYQLATDYTTYTKIGRQVTLNGQIKLGTSVTGGGTGYLQILGAPFTKAADTVASGAVVLSGINFTGDFVSISFASLGATTTIFLPETVDNASSTDLPISAAVANAQIQFTITYFV